MDIYRTKEKPQDSERLLWWSYAKRRRDWFMLIVQDQISGLEYPVYVPEFDDEKWHIMKHHRQNDQWVIASYETFGD